MHDIVQEVDEYTTAGFNTRNDRTDMAVETDTIDNVEENETNLQKTY